MDHWIWYRKLLWSPIRLSKRKLTSCYALHVPRFLLIVAFITLFSFVVFNIPRSSWMNQIILPPFIHPFIHDERGVNEWTNERKNEWTMKEGERHPLLKKRYWPGGITPGEEPTKRGGGTFEPWTLWTFWKFVFQFLLVEMKRAMHVPDAQNAALWIARRQLAMIRWMLNKLSCSLVIWSTKRKMAELTQSVSSSRNTAASFIQCSAS